MKKFLINIMLIVISLIIPNNVYAISTTEANEAIDVTKNCNLTLNYYYDDYNFDNTNVEIFHIASVTSDFRYELSSDFSNYPIKINGIKNEGEWNSLEQTLNAYITADSIKETTKQSIKNNTIAINDLTPGLYFIKTDKIDTKDYTLLFDSFLLSIPELKEDGTWNYDVTVYPKAEMYIPKYEQIKYTVIKEWVDAQKKRPKSIEIEIYEDGILVDNKTLSKDNNWKYQWTTDDDGSIWTVVEREIPKGYNVSIQNRDRNFTIVNTDPNYKEDNPKTYDNIKIHFYLLIGSIIGVILVIISLIVDKKQAE